jgi:predicted DCC family thiol-disulfide oxidoreductase YuxK
MIWDRGQNLYPLEIQAPRAQDFLSSVPVEERLQSAHIRGRGGAIHSGSEGAPELFALLPGGGPLAAIAIRSMPLVAGFYRLLTRARPLVGPRLPARLREWSDRRIGERQRGMLPPTAVR